MPEGFITTDLWPMAMDCACWVYTIKPKESTGLSPYELCTRSTYTPHKDLFRNCHVFVDTTYVLEPKIQKSGVKIPKWNPRSRSSAFMGLLLMN